MKVDLFLHLFNNRTLSLLLITRYCLHCSLLSFILRSFAQAAWAPRSFYLISCFMKYTYCSKGVGPSQPCSLNFHWSSFFFIIKLCCGDLQKRLCITHLPSCVTHFFFTIAHTHVGSYQPSHDQLYTEDDVVRKVLDATTNNSIDKYITYICILYIANY